MSSMFISLSNILRRSSNPAFQEACQTQLKVSGSRSYMVRKLNLGITQMLEKAMFASLADSENKLSSYLESPGSLDADKCQHALPDRDETVFIHAMEQIYWLAMKRRKFKVIAPSADLPSADPSKEHFYLTELVAGCRRQFLRPAITVRWLCRRASFWCF